MIVENRLIDPKSEIALTTLDYQYEHVSKVAVAHVAATAEMKQFIPPFEDRCEYMERIVIPAIREWSINTRHQARADLQRDLAERIYANAVPCLGDFPTLSKFVEKEIPRWKSADSILREVAQRAEDEVALILRVHRVPTRIPPEDALLSFDTSDSDLGIEAFTDPPCGAVTIMLDPTALSCPQFVTIDWTIVHELFSHVTAGRSVQEVKCDVHPLSAFSDGVEWEATAQAYPYTRSKCDRSPPSYRELTQYVAAARQDQITDGRSRIGIWAAESLIELLAEISQEKHLWSVIRILHPADYIEVHETLGHDAVVRAILRFCRLALRRTLEERLSLTKSLVRRLAHAVSPKDVVNAFAI